MEKTYITYQGIPNIGKDKIETWINTFNTKLDSMTKILTQWDLYKIDYVLTNPYNFRGAKNALLPNTAMVIDTNSFTEGSVEYNRGDLIFNDSKGIQTHIKASRGATYAPVRIATAEGNNCTITYKRIDSVPNDGEVTQEVNAEELTADEVKKTINYTGFTLDTTQALYNVNQIPTEGKISFLSQLDVLPVIKYYTGTDITGFEEVYFDDTRILDNGTWVISNIPSIVTKVVAK